MPKQTILIVLLVYLSETVYTQIPGLVMSRGANKIEIPFERQDNFIIVKIIFQGIFPLRFIVDTGAEYTILTKKEIASLLNTTYDREITLMGTDMSTQIKAYIARKIKLELTNLTLTKDILVLDDDYFKFDQFAGLDVQGILGAETFKGYVLKIDYTKQLLTLYDPSVFKESDHRKFKEYPLTITRSKPYLTTTTEIYQGQSISLKYLLDTGAALAFLLHTYSSPNLKLPEKVIKGNIGTGLGGTIEGFLGRLHSVDIGDYKLANPLCHFQELDSLNKTTDTLYLSGRNGLIGGDVLSRFNMIIDFAKEKLYLQPNNSFKERFEYDKSGLIFIAGGVNLSEFTVFDVLPNTPASEAEILRGDILMSVNRIPARFYSLGAINATFQKKAGKRVRLKLKRDDKVYTKTIRLRLLI